MIIHFICSGNAYRSRLAEAYLNSKQIQGIQATSSGIEERIHRLENGPVSWYAMRLLFNHKLIPHMSFSSRQTTKELLNKINLVIFMKQNHYEYCLKTLNYSSKQFEVWDIPDVGDFQLKAPFGSIERTLEVINITEKTFSEIKRKADELASKLSHKY